MIGQCSTEQVKLLITMTVVVIEISAHCQRALSMRGSRHPMHLLNSEKRGSDPLHV